MRVGSNLGPFVQRLRGSVAKLLYDLLPQWIEPPFWGDATKRGYFDGCLRSERQGRLTFRYVCTQCIPHRICDDPQGYPDTNVNVGVERAIKRASEFNAFMTGVRYKRYSG